MGTTAYPFGLPEVNDHKFTIDMMVQEPERVTNFLSDITLQGFFADRMFPNAGGVRGGSILFERRTKNDLYLTREVQDVAAGAEFPIVTADRQEPQVARVQKFGGKFFITEESRKRNDLMHFRAEAEKLGHNISRAIHLNALDVLDEVLTDPDYALLTFSVPTWRGTNPETTNTDEMPAFSLATIQVKEQVDELGYMHNVWILHPSDAMNFRVAYGDSWNQVLSAYGAEFITSNLVTPGEAFVIADRQPGQMRLESPLTTETWYEASTQRHWFQSYVTPLFFVHNPFAVYKVTGIADAPA